MGYGLLIAGFVLLANPVIHVVDIVPDAIGFFLIYGGLNKMSFFIGEIGQARALFFKLGFVQIAKFFSIAFIPYTSKSALVLMAFVYGVVELLLFIPALNALFEGISFSGLWYNGTAIYEKKTVKRLFFKTCEKNGQEVRKLVFAKRDIEGQTFVKRTIMGFYVFRVIATLIPELTELQLYDNLGYVRPIQQSYAYYKPFLYLVSMGAVLLYGILMIKRMASFFGKIRRDTAYIGALQEKYTRDILPKTNLFTAIHMKRALLFLGIAAVTSFIVPFDGVNLLVGIVSSAFLAIGALILRRYIKWAVAIVPICIVRAGLSIANLLCQLRFFSNSGYTIEAVGMVEKADAQYAAITTVATLEYVVALAAVLLFLYAVLRAVKPQLDSFGIHHDNVQYSKKAHDQEIYNEAKQKLLITAGLAALHYITAVAFHYLLPTVNVMSLLCPLVTAIYAAYLIYTVCVLNDRIYNREMDFC